MKLPADVSGQHRSTERGGEDQPGILPACPGLLSLFILPLVASAKRGDSVESGVVALRVPSRRKIGGASTGNTIQVQDD